jgi:iron complex outermembrane receptor protein
MCNAVSAEMIPIEPDAGNADEGSVAEGIYYSFWFPGEIKKFTVMKKKSILIPAVLLCMNAHSQFRISGKVYSESDLIPVQNASVFVDGSAVTVTDSEGNFTTAQKFAKGLHELQLTSLAFKKNTYHIDLKKDTVMNIVLSVQEQITEEIIVTATRAGEHMPVSSSQLDKTEIKEINTGVDMPYLLNLLPSLVVTSDAGNGVGYTGIRIRGTDPSRINVTVNGIPINDAESHNMYWVDLPDIASSVENLQVQRGVGTSTNGAAAFGGSINIQTLNASEEPYAEINSSAGSFSTFKNTLQFATGRINKVFSLDGRLSQISSDGYIDRASSDLKSFFLSGGYTGKKTIVRLQFFTGKEITYQSWNGVPESRMNNDYDEMLNYISRNFTTQAEADNLLNSGRTYNYYTYKNQVDNYQQDYYQLHFSHAINPAWKATASLHYTYGRGYYEEYKMDDYFSSYALPDAVTGLDTLSTSDIVRRKWLSNDFYGLTFSLNYDGGNKHQLIIGGAANEYDGRHFNELTWMEIALNTTPGQRYFSDNAVKQDENIFLKYTYNFTDKISFFTDHQLRSVNYQFKGLADADGTIVKQNDRLNFYNPKAGFYFTFTPALSSFIYTGIAHKEPNRDDYTESTIKSRPKPEQLTDYEAGISYKSRFIHTEINFYYMDYKDQLILTGAVNDVGNYTRTNTPKSYRAGIELQLTAHPVKNLTAGFNITLSKNKIRQFAEYITDYDDGSELVYVYDNPDIAFSPSVIAAADLRWSLTHSLSFLINAKYVGQQFLDNTSSDSRSIDPYETIDAGLTWSIHPAFVKEITAGFFVNNILDMKYASNGYTYAYYYGSLVRENMYYPQAGLNIAGKISVRF